MNTAIELHDSILGDVTKRENEIVIRLLPAYLHKSEGRPGIDSGTGWVQEACLILAEATASGGIPNLPCDIIDGELVVGGKFYENEIPVPLAVAEATELLLRLDSGRTLKVAGSGIRLELIGEPRYIDEFDP